ncbi:ubiquitin carboxyl-terminal hydrolase 3-like isoform X1 [Pieris brassicae]|uniref:ubiquitin carboxyl-terminal hydrolase 3-like isoform X1 n=1 Tax=Pieris brassicae TaxID=7116 RepID=UPI001E662783|nr:ubiquitin carboxyl-terminal hydrolase 3-like isoform X1 [Pieris brassicae]
MDCPHLLGNLDSNNIQNIVDIVTSKGFECSECSETKQNWLCLKCGVVSCGRYVNGHAKYHSESFDHQICMSCDVYSVYCYKCDEYVANDSEEQIINKIRQCIMPINNKGNPINKNETTEHNTITESAQTETLVLKSSGDPSEDSNLDISSVVNASIDSVETSEDQDDRLSKNPEETIRSLRPRSRKRSHSDDNATDAIQSNSKEKRLSSTNGKNHKEKRIVGLKNLGNTCFMNAVLQSLNNIQEFSCYFSQLPSLEVKTNGRKIYHSRSYSRQEMHDVVMAEELRKVLINLNNGGCSSKGAISPECLFLVIWKVVPRFRGYQQQDAHEFLRYMLDRLHTELLQLLPPEKAEGGFVPRVPSTSIVTAVFGGTLQSQVCCLVCGTESKKFDPFLDLSLDLPECGRHDAPVTLTDCLASFVQVEELADTERYFCSSCKSKQKSTKQFWIRRLPNVLCLHLKRFRWHNYFRTKVDTAISFPLNSLDMSRFVLANVPDTRRSGRGNYLYDLAAVIVHHGSGAGSGHYTAFAINEEQWFHFNDQTVRPTDANVVASCKPYIMFYIRREFSLPSTT